ncbi:MAG: glycosyltransferase family 2 protein [Selenomonadaceae bacterium]|nr:glycosyltransferase family 2 protein [Selenomonadaceae bacterium]
MYNAGKYIEECLDSLLAQTFQDFEVIVVDDCSMDNSVQIVESYKEKFYGRLQLVVLEKNSGGGSKPRNLVLKLSRGEYIFFVDSDDFIMLNALETLYTTAEEYDAEVVYYSSNYHPRRKSI